MERFAQLVVGHPKAILAAWLVLTAFLGYGLHYRTTDLGESTFLVEDDPEKLFYDEAKKLFGFEQVVAIGLSGADVFSLETLAKVDRISRRVEALDHVEDVQSLTTIEDIIGTEEGFEIRNLREAASASPDGIGAIRERARANPIIAKNLIAEDGRSTFILVFMEQLADDADKKNEILGEIEEIAFAEKGPEEVGVSGGALIWTEMSRIQARDSRLLAVTFLAMVAILFYLFRSLRGVALPLATSLFAIVWTLGLCSWLRKPIDPMVNIIPSIVVAIGVAYTIHLLTQYYEEAAREDNRETVVRNAIRGVGSPIALSGFTTFVGFSSLAVSDIPMIREWGPLAAFGVLSVTVAAFFVMPAVLALLPVQAKRQNLAAGEHAFGRGMERLGATTMRRGPRILVGSIALTAVAAVGATLVRYESNPIFFFEKDSKLYRAFEFFDERRLGPYNYPISVRGEPDIFKDPEVLRALERLQAFLDSRPEYFYRTNSIVDFVKLMNRATFADDPKEFRIPDTREAVAQYFLLYSLSGDESRLARFVNYDYSHAYIVANTSGLGPVERFERMNREVERFLEENPIPGTEQRLTGDGRLRVNAARAVVMGMLQSLGLALVVITVTLGVLFRSAMAGAFCMVPNVLPILVNFGIMGFAGIRLDFGTAYISSVVIGIAVDDTIHFLHRYRREYRTGRDHARTLRRTLGTTGRAITFTSITLLLGFAALLLSDFAPLRYFGLLVAVTMISCLVGDLLLLPALILRFRPSFIEGHSGPAVGRRGPDAIAPARS
jgi:predicted RND superfamily exporter protein